MLQNSEFKIEVTSLALVIVEELLEGMNKPSMCLVYLGNQETEGCEFGGSMAQSSMIEV